MSHRVGASRAAAAVLDAGHHRRTIGSLRGARRTGGSALTHAFLRHVDSRSSPRYPTPVARRLANATGTAPAFEFSVLGKGGLPGDRGGSGVVERDRDRGREPGGGGGFVTVFPCGIRPDASNLNFVAGQTVPNAVIAPVSSTGTVCFYVYGTAHLLADVSGYFPTGSDFTTLDTGPCARHPRGAKVGSAAGSGAPLRAVGVGQGRLAGSGSRCGGVERDRCRGREPDRRRRLRDPSIRAAPDRRVEPELRRRPDRSEPRDRTGVGDGQVCFYVYGTAICWPTCRAGSRPEATFVPLTPARASSTLAAASRSATPPGPARSWRCRSSDAPVCPVRASCWTATPSGAIAAKHRRSRHRGGVAERDGDRRREPDRRRRVRDGVPVRHAGRRLRT